MTTTASLFFPSPASLGMPGKFLRWRQHQVEALEAALGDEHRFVAECMPTGSGKSLFYVGWSQAQGGRTVILTSTRALQDQLLADFREIGLTDIRGMNNYECKANFGFVQGRGQKVGCDEGPCHSGQPCDLRQGGCLYFDAVRAARRASLVVTNYSYWMFAGDRDPDDGLGRFDNLILDEAHDAPGQLASFLGEEIGSAELGELVGEDWRSQGTAAERRDFQWWKEWARAGSAALEREIESRSGEGAPLATASDLRYLRDLRAMQKRLARLSSASGTWVVEEYRDYRMSLKVRFDPVFPAEYAEETLFQGVRHVLLTSATVRPKTLEMLGLAEDDYGFYETPSTFPVRRRPVVWIPTARLRHGSGNDRLWVSRIDQILDKREGLRGIVHTTSYKRAKYLLDTSRHSRAMVLPDQRSTRVSVELFKAGRGPAVLVSPAITTGFDFPGPQCRFNIIVKVPFADTRSLILQAQQEQDKDWLGYMTMQQLVQAAGRGSRSEDDWCETFILDDNISWFMRRYRKFAPKWFLDAYKVVQVVEGPQFKGR